MEYASNYKNGKSLIVLKGIINEDDEASLRNLFNEIKNSKTVFFNFAQVRSINSLGVREWVNFLRSLHEIEGSPKKIFFQECPPHIIMQINMIPSFLGNATVESFYVNYMCERCSARQEILVKTKELVKNALPRPPICKKDRRPMQTEELEDEYFLFLKRLGES